MPGRIRLRAAAAAHGCGQVVQTAATRPLSRSNEEQGMTDSLVSLNVADGVGLISLNRPPVNALNERVRGQLVACCREAQEREDVRAVVVAGAGKHFAAGADITE